MRASNLLSRACLGVVLFLTFSFFSFSCSSGPRLSEKAYAIPERIKLKSSTAQAARLVGELKSGDLVTITDRSYAEDRSLWVRVNGPGGESGWVEARYLVKERFVEESRRLAEQFKDIQTQAIGKSKATLKFRMTPDRSAEDNVATQLASGTIVEIVARERRPKPPASSPETEGEAQSSSEVKYDEWYLVRLKEYAVLPAGWIYGGSVGLEIPSEIVYFVSSGRRIVGWQNIATIHGDDSKSGDHFLVLERKNFDADERIDFDRVKVLAYDPYSRNYTTPFREDISGRFPVKMSMEGTRGRFELNVLDKNGQFQKFTYGIEMLDGGKIKVAKPQ